MTSSLPETVGAPYRQIAAQTILTVKQARLRSVLLDNVEPGSIVPTDDLMSYNLLWGDGYKHGRVKHGAKTGAIGPMTRAPS